MIRRGGRQDQCGAAVDPWAEKQIASVVGDAFDARGMGGQRQGGRAGGIGDQLDNARIDSGQPVEVRGYGVELRVNREIANPID